MATKGKISALALRPLRGARSLLALSFAAPRTTALLSLPRDPASAAGAVSPALAAGATVVVPAGPPGLRAWRDAFAGAEVLRADPQEALRFLWFYRDEHDPLALGHAAERDLLAERYLTRPAPRLGPPLPDVGSLALLRAFVLETGFNIGVRPPLPASRGSRTRATMTAFVEACLLLYTALLHRWRAPIAHRRGDRLFLADRWLAHRAGGSPP